MTKEFENLKNGHVIYVRIHILSDMMELIHRHNLQVKLTPMGSDVFQVEKL